MILLKQGDPLIHPWVIRELASSVVATEGEILRSIDVHRLMGRGIG